jgi:ThiF family/Prokaryotic homologs of the JAB domain
MSTQRPSVTLSLTEAQHTQLRTLLFLPDGKEAVAIALCGRRAGERRHRLLVQEIYAVPQESYAQRSVEGITWSTDCLTPLLDKAEKQGLSVVKIHSHPGGYAAFSEIDDVGDRQLMPAIRGWVEADIPHASAIMLPNDRMFGRVLWPDNEFKPLDCIAVTGADLHFWYHHKEDLPVEDFTASHAQAFGQGTTERLRRLSIAVVGCSGTGSPVIEQLVRLGVGEIVLVDDDYAEERNINRILNSTIADALQQRSKAEMIAGSIERIGLGTNVRVFKKNLWDPEVVKAVAECDVVFGCMDTIDGRFLLNTIATHYTIPYFDLGVRLEAIAEGSDLGRIREICGTVHYLQPGRSSLMSRGLVTMEKVREAGLRRNDPGAYRQQVEDGYIRGVEVHRPAVISVNMFIASLAVNDFLARLHPYREEPNSAIASIEFSLSSLEFFPEPEGDICNMLHHTVGLGDRKPLLGLLELNC